MSIATVTARSTSSGSSVCRSPFRRRFPLNAPAQVLMIHMTGLSRQFLVAQLLHHSQGASSSGSRFNWDYACPSSHCW